jgi:hypothetical protein
MVRNTLSMDTILFVIILLVMVADYILLVVLGQKTLRKLRKNPETKNALGIEFLLGGGDIVNVSFAFGIPRRLNRKARNNKLGALFADADLLEKHMTRFDILLSKLVFFLGVAWVSPLLFLVFLFKIGVFE